jgi:hypothetical protein
MASQYLDRKSRPLVAVTGMGVVTSLGRGKEENWLGLASGSSGIRPITRFPTDGFKTTIAGTIETPETQPYSAYESAGRSRGRCTSRRRHRSSSGRCCRTCTGTAHQSNPVPPMSACSPQRGPDNSRRTLDIWNSQVSPADCRSASRQ